MTSTRPSTLDYKCPTCGAEPGKSCRTLRSATYTYAATAHKPRIRLFLREHAPEVYEVLEEPA